MLHLFEFWTLVFLTTVRQMLVPVFLNDCIVLLFVVQVTAEHESGIHIWDLRKPKVPIRELPGHTHWYMSCEVAMLLLFF